MWNDAQLDYLYAAENTSFARLTEEAIELLVLLSPLIDVGAGNGYWAQQLTGYGADIIGIEPNDAAHPCFPTIKADHHAIVDYPDRTLLLIWPTRKSDWPAECVGLYKGNTVVYVGDPMYEWTASPALPVALRGEGFKRRQHLVINSWPHFPMIDTLTVWSR